MDRGHPGLGMRPDEIEGLTGELKPNPIHEIRCPIRLERPGGYRKLLQQRNLQLQFCIGPLQLTIKAARLRQPLFAGAQFLAFEFRLAAHPFFAFCSFAAKIGHFDVCRYTRQQLPRSEWLDEIVVGVGLQSFHARLFARPRRHQDHWGTCKGGVLANRSE